MGDATIHTAVEEYLATLKGAVRGPAMAELSRFSAWCGNDRLPSHLKGHDIATYAETMGPASEDNVKRAEHIRKFLAFLKKQSYTEQSLASHFRLKKAAKSAGARANTAAAPSTVELTADGIKALETEYESLIEQRIAVRADIGKAMADKDFRENAPLDAAKDKQGHIEARIREIKTMLERAVVVEGAAKAGRIHVGSRVRVKDLGTSRQMEYSIVGPSEANAAEGKISSVSPVGKALLDHTAGDEVEISVPAGTMRLNIESVEG
jgi:transcription elongation factor GreA